MALRCRIRWVVRHGLIRRTVHQQMRAGDLGSRLMVDPVIRDDPFPCYDQLRAQDRIVRSGLALLSAHHDVCLAVLRNPDFGQMRLDRLPGLLRLAMKLGGRPVLGPIEPPSMLAVDPPIIPATAGWSLGRSVRVRSRLCAPASRTSPRNFWTRSPGQHRRAGQTPVRRLWIWWSATPACCRPP